MSTTRSIVVCALAWGLGLMGPPLPAEVRVVTGKVGEYLGTEIVVARGSGLDLPRVWSAVSRTAGTSALNLDGDRNGDLWPTIQESSVAPHHPWVVWSRFDGVAYELSWSRWDRVGWTPTRAIEQPPGADSDLDPRMAMDPIGTPFLVWWRDAAVVGGKGRVFLSVFLNDRWTPSYPVSHAADDSTHPSVVVVDDQTLQVEYDVSGQRVSQLVSFSRPVTITDDVNPLGLFTNLGQPVSVQQRPR